MKDHHQKHQQDHLLMKIYEEWNFQEKIPLLQGQTYPPGLDDYLLMCSSYYDHLDSLPE
jgi:hypothetical protein